MNGFARYTNRDFVFKESESKVTLSFNIESIDIEVDDKMIIMLAIDALAGLIEDNDYDPDIIFNEVIKCRRIN